MPFVMQGFCGCSGEFISERDANCFSNFGNCMMCFRIPNNLMKRSLIGNFNIDEKELKEAQTLILEFENGQILFEQLTPEQVLLIVRVILAKSSYHRTNAEIDILKKATKENEFFRNLVQQTSGEYLWERCLRKMSYYLLAPGGYLFKEGERGTTFYIILQGTVSIVKRVEVAEDRFQERELVQMSDGKSFGELALVNDAPRSATVKGVTTVHLGVLDAEDYMVIYKTFKNQQRQLYFEEFAKLSLFQNWKFFSIKALFDCIHFHKYGLNHQVYKEGDPSNEIYFIQTGEFKVIKSLRSNKHLSEEKETKDDLEYLKDQFAFKKPKQSNQEIIDELFKRKKYGGLIASDKKLVMTLKFLGPGEMFGELEVIKAPDLMRQFSVISTQEQNRVYSVSKRDFIRVLQTDPMLGAGLTLLVDSKLRQILTQIKVYEKNFIDQSEKFQQLERTQNKDFLNPQEIEDDDSGQRENKGGSQLHKISSRRRQNDCRTRELTLTMESPEIEFTLSHHGLKSQKHQRQPTSELSIQTPRRLQKIIQVQKKKKNFTQRSLVSLKLGQINIKIPNSPHTHHFSSNPAATEYRSRYPPQQKQVYFNPQLPLVLQSKYYRFKSKENLN